MPDALLDRIDHNIGQSLRKTLEKTLQRPVSTWSLDICNHLLDPENNPSHIHHLFQTWLQDLTTQSPWFVRQNKAQCQQLLSQPRQPIQDLFTNQFYVGPIHATGYENMSMSMLSPEGFHQPKYTYRNEWWNLTGILQQEQQQQEEEPQFCHLQIWRHTFIPPTAWTKDKPPSYYSLVNVTLTIDQDTVFHLLVPESFHVAQFQPNCPFFFQILDTCHLKSEHNDSLFPLQMQWYTAMENTLSLNLMNEKPLFMTKSNGCVQCSNGMGLKQYVYPLVTGNGWWNKTTPVTFQGSLDHSWESGMLPEGYPASLHLRSLMAIEKSWHKVLRRPDNWCYFFLHLDNNTQVACYIMTSPKTVGVSVVPHVLVLVNADGTVNKLHDSQVKVEHVRDNKYVTNMWLTCGNDLHLQLFVSADDFHVRHVLDHHSYEFVYCFLHVQGKFDKATKTKGFGYMYITNQEQQQELIKSTNNNNLSSDFRHDQRNDNHDDHDDDDDMTNVAYLVWLVPLLVISIIFIFIVYLVWSRQISSYTNPWMKSLVNRRRYTFWSR